MKLRLNFRLIRILIVLAALPLGGCSLVPTKGFGNSSSSSKNGSNSSTSSGSSSRATTSFSPSSDGRKDVRDAIAKLNSTYPYRLTETMSSLANGGSTIPGGTRVVEVEASDRLHMKWTGGVGGDVEAITIGDKHYWYSNGKWTEGGISQRANSGVDFAKKLGEMVTDVKYLGPETVNGLDCYAYLCTFDGAREGQSWSGTSKVWIGAGDGLPHQSDSDIKFGGYGGKSHIVYDYNVDVKVEKPAM